MSVTVDAPYLPFRALDHGRFRWRLGLHPLDLGDWIELGPDAETAIAAKGPLAAEHPDVVFAVLDGVEDECEEVATALLDHVRRRWPERYGGVELDRGLHPLAAAARLVPEDLVVMAEREGRLVFGGGSVSFPNRWDLRSKLGCTLAEVHAPVPRLNDQLGVNIDRFLDHLVPERSFWRLGWGLIDTADWYAPPVPGVRPPPALDRLHLRVERETFRRFPVTRCVLFTLRTYVTPGPRVAARSELAAAIDVLPDDVREYKGLAAVAADLLVDLGGGSHRT